MKLNLENIVRENEKLDYQFKNDQRFSHRRDEECKDEKTVEIQTKALKTVNQMVDQKSKQFEQFDQRKQEINERMLILEAELAEHPEILAIIDAPSEEVEANELTALQKEIAEVKAETKKN